MKDQSWFKGPVVLASLLVLLVDFLIAIASNLIASALEKFLGTSGLTVPIFLVIGTALLLVLRAALNASAGEQRDSKSTGLSAVFPRLPVTDFLKWLLTEIWRQFVLLLGIATTIGAIVLLIQNGIYPERLELKSLVFWGEVILWLFTFLPLGLGFTYYEDKSDSAKQYKARMKAKWHWKQWQRAIHRSVKDNQVRQEWLQDQMPGYSVEEVKEAMRLYAIEFGVRLKREIVKREVKLSEDAVRQSGTGAQQGLNWTGIPRTTYTPSGLEQFRRSSTMGTGWRSPIMQDKEWGTVGSSPLQQHTITITEEKFILKWRDAEETDND